LAEPKKRRNERTEQGMVVQGAAQRPLNRLPQLAAGVAVLASIIAGGFYFGTLQMRTEFGERIAGVETNVKGLENSIKFLFEKYVLRDKELQTKAANTLKTPNVQLAYVNLRSNVAIAVPDKTPPPPISVQEKETTKTIFITYTIEGVVGNSIIIRAQIKDEKFEKTLYDRRIEVRIPTDEKRATLRLRFELTPGPVHTPPVRLEIVVLERLSPTDLIIATGLDASPASAT
jgi:hypothetical protein